MKDLPESAKKAIEEKYPKERNVCPSYQTLMEIAEFGYQLDRWISVGERLPNKDKTVLIFLPSCGGQILTASWEERGYWIADTDHIPLEDTTHWMPLPEPPKPKALRIKP